MFTNCFSNPSMCYGGSDCGMPFGQFNSNCFSSPFSMNCCPPFSSWNNNMNCSPFSNGYSNFNSNSNFCNTPFSGYNQFSNCTPYGGCFDYSQCTPWSGSTPWSNTSFSNFNNSFSPLGWNSCSPQGSFPGFTPWMNSSLTPWNSGANVNFSSPWSSAIPWSNYGCTPSGFCGTPFYGFQPNAIPTQGIPSTPVEGQGVACPPHGQVWNGYGYAPYGGVPFQGWTPGMYPYAGIPTNGPVPVNGQHVPTGFAPTGVREAA